MSADISGINQTEETHERHGDQCQRDQQDRHAPEWRGNISYFQTSRKQQGWDYFGRDGQRGHSPLKSVVHGDLSK